MDEDRELGYERKKLEKIKEERKKWRRVEERRESRE